MTLHKIMFNFSSIVIAALLLTSCSLFESGPEAPQRVRRSAEKTVIARPDEVKAESYVKLGSLYLQMGKLDAALDNLEKALELDSDNAQAHNAIAALFEKINNYDKAKYHYEEALSLSPDMSGAHNNYGRLLCKVGEYEKGMSHLKQAISLPLNNRPWYALTNAGECELKKDNKLVAEGYFMEALQVRPSFTPALKAMLNIQYEKEKYLSARAYLERYLNYGPKTPEVLWLGMQIERMLGYEENAEEYKDNLLRSFPASDEAMKIRNTTL